MNEFVPGYEADSFHGIAAPRGTPPQIVDQINREINRRWPTPGSRRGWPISAPRCSPARPKTSAATWRRKSTSGARW